MAAKAPQQWRREPTPPLYGEGPPVEYDVYGNAVPTESKRDKRRRDMVDRVSRLHADTIERRDQIFQDLSTIQARTADELLPPPVFPTFDLSIPVGQLPPSLPFTDPVIPDMHPTPYLFALHRLSHERANTLLAIRLFHAHQAAVARRMYDAEVERIEDEYEGATKGVVERLLEGVEERRRRLVEEKDGEGVSLETFLDPQRQHGTRRKGGNNRLVPHSRPHHDVSPPDGNNSNPNSTASTDPATNLLNLGGVQDHFHLANALLAPSPALPLLSALAGGGTTASLLTASLQPQAKKKTGVRAPPGLPPPHMLVTSGQYAYGKSILGLSTLRGDEVDADLGEVRRKRARGAGGGAAARRRLDRGE